jgi:hypothetical protein
MAALTDFTILEITPEFKSGSEVVTVKSVVPGVRSGIALIPNTTPVGLSIYNTDNITNYGFADLLIHPGLPDTVLLTSRAVGTGIKPTKIKSTLRLELSENPVSDMDAATKEYVDSKLSGTVGVKTTPTITTAAPSANYITVEYGEYAVYNVADYTGTLYIITPDAAEINIATDGVPYYIYAEYNGSNGVVAATTDEHSCHVGTRAIIAKVIRTGTTFHIVSNDRLANGLPEKLHLMTSSILGYNVETGLELSVNGSRQVTCDSGTVWNGAVETHLDAIDTSGADQYLSVTWNGSAWAFAPTTSLNNTQYNSPAGVQSLTGSNYAVNWIYRGVEEQKHLYVLLGTTNDKLDVTEAANPPIPPSWITDHSVLLGRVLFRRNDNTPIIETTSDLGHTFVGAIRHNDTTGRQGGTTDEYYHMTKSQFDNWDGKNDRVGIPADASGAYLTTLTYNETTRTVTIAPLSGDTFDFYIGGIKHTKTGPQSLAHTDTVGGHFFYFNSVGTLVTSTTPWNILLDASVAYVYWDATNDNGKGVCFEERHHAGRDVWWHRNQHFNEGTKASSGFVISGYTLDVGTANSAITWAMSTGRAEDEDIRIDTEAVPDGGPYVVMHRTGGTGTWKITRDSVFPALYSGAILQYNQYNGSSWVRTSVPEDNFINYYVFGATSIPSTNYTPALTTTQQIVIIPGQAVHATKALATAESVASINWGTLPFQEIVPLYRVTFHYNAAAGGAGGFGPAYTSDVRGAIVDVTRIAGTSVSITQAAQAAHNSLTGLNLGDYQHLTAAEYAGTGTGVFVRTTDPTFANNVTITGELRGPASFVIDPSAVGDNTGTVVIKGNLQVDGLTTTINSTTLTVDDLNINLASGAASAAAANGAGITVDGSSATLTYLSADDSWNSNKRFNVAAPLSALTGSKIGAGTAITGSGRDYLTLGGTALGSIAFKNATDAVTLYMQSGAANFDIFANTGGTLRLGANGTDGIAIVSSTGLLVNSGTLTVGSSTPLTIQHNYGGSGAILAGNLIASGGTNLSFIPDGSGAAYTLSMAYYNGAAWYSAFKYSNVAGGGATRSTLYLMQGGGTTDINNGVGSFTSAGLTITGVLTVTGATNLDAGTLAAPGLYLEGETGTGLYRINANNHGYSVSGSKVLDIGSTGLTVTGALTGTSTVTAGTINAGLTMRGYFGSSSYGAIYHIASTASATNAVLISNETTTILSGTTSSALAVNGSTNIAVATSSGLTVTGDTTTSGKLNAGKFHYAVLQRAQGAEFTAGVKIKTNIPGGSGFWNDNVTTIWIEAYNYRVAKTMNLCISWYGYTGGNTFLSQTASSYGGLAPAITLSIEAGKVVISLSINSGGATDYYYSPFTIRAYDATNADSAYTGWTIVDEAVTGTQSVSVTYTNRFGNTTIDGTLTTAAINMSGALSITNTTDTTSTATGALLVSGGVGIAKKLTLGSATTHTQSNAFGQGDISIDKDVYSTIGVFSHDATDGNFPAIVLGRSGGTKASQVVVTTTQTLGGLFFTGWDGVNATYRTAASIRAFADGTVSSGIVPGALSFRTANASGTETERIRISSGGATTITGTLNVTSDTTLTRLYAGGGNTNWPTTTIASTTGRHILNGSTYPMLVLWNEEAASIAEKSAIYIGGKTGAGATTFGGGRVISGLLSAATSQGYMDLQASHNAGFFATPAIRISGKGSAVQSAVLIGTTTDDGSNLLQVAGNTAIAGVISNTLADNNWNYRGIAASGEVQLSGWITGQGGPAIRAVNVGGGAYTPLNVDGSFVYLRSSGTTIGTVSSTGLVVTGALAANSSTGSVTSDGSVGNAFFYAKMSGTTRATFGSAGGITILDDTYAANGIAFQVGGSTKAALTVGGNFALIAANKLYLDGIAGTGDTYLVESSANVLDIYAGAAKALSLTATTITNQGIIKFQPTGGSVSAITLNTLTDGTLSFEGTAGQLFSIGNSLTGTIFTVNDVSGMPSIEVLDTGLVKLAEYNGSVQIGSATVASNTVNYGYMTIGPTAGVTGAIHRPYTAAATNAAIYNAGVTPGASNYALLHNATTTVLNATTNTYLNVNNNTILTAASTGITLNGTLTASIVDAGVGTITEAARFSRSGATPTATDRGIGIAFGDADNFTLVGGVAGIRTGSDGNYNGDLILYASSSGGSPTTTLGGLTERLRVVGTTGVSVTGTLSSTSTTTAQGYLLSGTSPPSGTVNNVGVYASGLWLNSATATSGYLAVGGSGVLQWLSTGVAVTGILSNDTGVTGTSIRAYTGGLYGAIYNSSVTANTTNYALAHNATRTVLSAVTTTDIAVSSNVIISAISTGATVTGTLTATGNATVTGGLVTLNNGTSNQINYGSVGLGAPTFNSYSAGAKLVLWNSVGAGGAGYTIGMESANMNFGVHTTAEGFKWYGGTTLAATLTGAGNFSTVGDISNTSATASRIITAGTTLTTGNAAVTARSGTDPTIQMVQFGATAAGTTFGISNNNLATIYTTTYATTHPTALAIGTISSTPLVFGTAGAERMRVLSSGEVGIGTTAPASRLQVGDTTVSVLNQIILGKYETSSENNLPRIQTKSVLSAAASCDLALGATSTSGGILFYTGNNTTLGSGSNTLKVTISASGNLLMGVTAPIAVGTPTFTLSGANPYIELNANAGSHTQIRLYSIGVYKGGLLKQTTDDIALTSVAGKSVQISVDGASTVAANFAATTGYLSIGYTTSAARTNLHIAKAANTLAALKSTVANAAMCITSPGSPWTNYAPGIVWSTEDDNSTLTKAGIFANFTGSGSYLRFGTSNSYATGITNDALVIDFSGNSIFGGSYISVGTGTIGKIRLKQTADDYSNGITLQRASTLDSWQFVVGSDSKFYLGYATAASGADASGDFTNEMVIDTSGNVTFTGSVTATSITAPTAMGTLYTGVDTGAAGTCNIDGPACPLTQGGIYEVFISVNYNNGGSSSYREMITGYITINTGYNGSAVANYIDYMQLSPSIPVTGLGAAMSVAVTTWNGTTEATTYLTTANPIPNIRIKVTGWQGTASSGTCRIARKM